MPLAARLSAAAPAALKTSAEERRMASILSRPRNSFDAGFRSSLAKMEKIKKKRVGPARSLARGGVGG